jgi:hypothetical protein
LYTNRLAPTLFASRTRCPRFKLEPIRLLDCSRFGHEPRIGPTAVVPTAFRCLNRRRW